MQSRRRRAWVRGVAVVLSTLVLGACSRAGSTPSADRLRSGAFTIGYVSDFSTLNPLISTSILIVGPLVFSYLVTDGLDGGLVPDVAEAVPTTRNGGISPDGLTLTYHLRRDVRWQDGTPLTARDCAFTFAAVMNPRNNVAARGSFAHVRRVETPDPYTLVVHLNAAYAPTVDSFLALDGYVPILPAHLLARYRDLNAVPYNAQPVGSGPFRIRAWKRGEALEFESNPAYFRGAPAVRRITLKFVPQNQTLVQQLRLGEIDAVLFVDAATHDAYAQLPGIRLVSVPVPAILTLTFNTAAGPTADVRVRRAVADAVDVTAIVQKATHGAFDERDALQGIFGWAYRPVPSTRRYDPALANRLLDAAGWRRGADGVRVKNGQRLALSLAMTTFYASSESIATIVQAQLREVGAAVTIRPYPASLFAALASQGGPVLGGKFDLVIWAPQTGGDPDTSSMFACDQRAPHGGNVARLCDPRIDRLEADGVRAFDASRRVRDAVAIERLLDEDVPQITLGRALQFSAIPETMRGFAPSPATPYTGAWRWSFADR